MNTFSRQFLAALTISLLVGCSHPTPTRSGSTLDETEVIRIAADAATKHGYRLADYDAPRAHYEFTRKDQRWTVFYEGKIRAPGHHFLVWVDDRTRGSCVMPGE
jgi:hypothetical protein